MPISTARCLACSMLTAVALATVTAPGRAQPPNPYHTVAGWLQPPPGRKLGSASMVATDARGNVWLAERCGENSRLLVCRAPAMQP
jgi:hypothetical protein